MDEVIQNLQDQTYKNKLDCFHTLKEALEKDNYISNNDIQRILRICTQKLVENYKYVTAVLNVISLILKRLKKQDWDHTIDLIPAALAVLNIIKTTSTLCNVQALRGLCCGVFLSFPEETLATITNSHTEEVMELYTDFSGIPIDSNTQILEVMTFLKILPPEKRTLFVKDNISAWFMEIIPKALNLYASADNDDHLMTLETLELLTEELVKFKYHDNPAWHILMESICNPSQYPKVMLNLLQNGNEHWHRLWIVFIKLLNTQITLNNGKSGTPINSMLPVVETAFKMGVANRCRAFKCWDVLIDIFSSEINDNCIGKRLKLLIIPLKLNNAKIEEAVVAKFNTWWLLITKFQSKLDKFLEIILLSFLQFAFGKQSFAGKPVIVPGQFSAHTKHLCLKALVEIVGHTNCNGCTGLPPLNGRILTINYMVKFWNDWIYSIKVAIKTNVSSNDDSVKQQMKCLWTSLVLTVSELPDNNIRADLFNEAMSILAQLVLDCDQNDKVTELLFEALIEPMFKELKIQQLVYSRYGTNKPFLKVIDILVTPPIINWFSRMEDVDIVSKLKSITRFMIESWKAPSHLELILNCLTVDDHCLKIWVALVETALESLSIVTPTDVGRLLTWPLKNDIFLNVKYAALIWYKLYDLSYPQLHKFGIDDELPFKLELSSKDNSESNMYFTLCRALAVLKHQIINDKIGTRYILLTGLITRVQSYEQVEKIFPIMIDVVVLVINTSISKHEWAESAMTCVKHMLKLVIPVLKHNPDNTTLSLLVKNMLKEVTSFFKQKPSNSIEHKIIDELIELTSLSESTSNLVQEALNMLKSFLLIKELSLDKQDCLKIQNAIKVIEQPKVNDKDPVNDDVESNAVTPVIEEKNKSRKVFTTPKTKEAPKKSKKKEASIVNTVVENGEEYVVVKSNWKFNPRKLTEAQKEKLQRKREDIPALYQDLSQSQDEFKLATWKTDTNSQDTTNSTSNSKSINAEDAKSLFKDLESTSVVPKIMENILSNNDKEQEKVTTPKSMSKVCHKLKESSPKTPKSPRMALKDRVFKNVRNLIENSTSPVANKKEDENQKNITNITAENIPKTPTSTPPDSSNLINSAPPMISADRPSRVKRKPRKFEDTQLFALKKRRYSQSDSQQTNPKSLSQDSSENSQMHEVSSKGDVQVHPIASTVEDSVVKVTESAKNVDPTVIVDQAIEESVSKSKKKLTLVFSEKNKVNERMDGESRQNENEAEIVTVENYIGQSDILNETSENLKEPVCNSTSPACSVGKPSAQLPEPETGLTESAVTMIEPAGALTKPVASLTESAENVAEPIAPLVESTAAAEKDTAMTESLTTLTDSAPLEPASEPKKDTEKKVKCDKKLKNSEEIISKKTEAVTTPQSNKTKTSEEKSSVKKVKGKSIKKIQKELAIDMVEGHPFLQTPDSLQRRATRKSLSTAVINTRKTSVLEKLDKSKSESKTPQRAEKKIKEKEKSKSPVNTSKNSGVVVLSETQDKDSQSSDLNLSQDMACSEDVIESSQDSTFTTMSIKSVRKNNMSPVVCLKKTTHLQSSKESSADSQNILGDLEGRIQGEKRSPVVAVERISLVGKVKKIAADTQYAPDSDSIMVELPDASVNQENKDDTVLPLNKTAQKFKDKDVSDLTENMDTEPTSQRSSDDVILITDDVVSIVVNTEDTCVGKDTQETADADTLPVDPNDFTEVQEIRTTPPKRPHNKRSTEKVGVDISLCTPDDLTITLSETIEPVTEKANEACSPLKDDPKRKRDFLDNTSEISPIKIQSPTRNEKSPSPETSSDYVVIKLTSPVHSNGEPFEKASPEFFTDDKVSPDKRDQSPPRTEANTTVSSPSSSLSLKKRPQVRPGGRGAQMLGLCVPENIHVGTQERCEEEPKKCATSTPARRNLRMLYNNANETAETEGDVTTVNNDSENFLKLKRSLPAVGSSPAQPILKRKLADMGDDASCSPASKRKRVSFHDPPVSTTVSVHKYIEPFGARSPQQSFAQRRAERQLRSHTNMKSPKRLENAFKLDTVLTKAVESFDCLPMSADDTQSSMDTTPAVEIVIISDLNDVDPICKELVNCTDLVANVAAQLSSPAMKESLVKEWEGKIATVGDLAKMTELEVNRLCVKAPKVKIVKKVLTSYAIQKAAELNEVIIIEDVPEVTQVSEEKCKDMEVQTTSVPCSDVDVQTEVGVTPISTQTDAVSAIHSHMQTDESGFKTTADVIRSCLAERDDFVEQLKDRLEEATIRKLTDKLSMSTIADLFMEKIGPSPENGLIFLHDFLTKGFESKDLILFCSKMLKTIHDKSA